MAVRIADDTMTLEIGDHVVATARFSERAAVGAVAGGPSSLTRPGCCTDRHGSVTTTGPERRMVTLTGQPRPGVGFFLGPRSGQTAYAAAMSAFTDAEIDFVSSQRLGRGATVGLTGCRMSCRSPSSTTRTPMPWSSGPT